MNKTKTTTNIHESLEQFVLLRQLEVPKMQLDELFFPQMFELFFIEMQIQ